MTDPRLTPQGELVSSGLTGATPTPPKNITGAAVVGSAALVPALQDAVSDIFSVFHIQNGHPGSWAVLILAGLGLLLHRFQNK